jgi:hypothetical protein
MYIHIYILFGFNIMSPACFKLYQQIRLAIVEPVYADVYNMAGGSENGPWPYVLYGDEGSGLAEVPTLVVTVRPIFPWRFRRRLANRAMDPWLTRFVTAVLPNRKCVRHSCDLHCWMFVTHVCNMT